MEENGNGWYSHAMLRGGGEEEGVGGGGGREIYKWNNEVSINLLRVQASLCQEPLRTITCPLMVSF